MNLKFATHVRVFARDEIVYRTHPAEAARLVREGLAIRRGKDSRIGAIDLITIDTDDYSETSRIGNPQKYTRVESVGAPSDCPCGKIDNCPRCGGRGHIMREVGHIHAHKRGIAHPQNWPFYRAALVDCLPAAAQSEIRQIFS